MRAPRTAYYFVDKSMEGGVSLPVNLFRYGISEHCSLSGKVTSQPWLKLFEEPLEQVIFSFLFSSHLSCDLWILCFINSTMEAED